MFIPCKDCPSRDACKRHGCRAWNDDARKKIECEENSLRWEHRHVFDRPNTPNKE